MTTGTVGNTATPSGGGWQSVGINVQNEVATGFTMPTPGGRITALHAYFDLDTGASPATAWLCLWDAGGNLLASVAVSVNVGVTGGGAQHWHTAALSGYGVYVKGGSTVYLGFAVQHSSGAIWSYNTTGGAIYTSQASPPASLAGNGPTGTGSIGAYGDYVLCLRKRRRAGVWVESPKRVRRAGAWVIGPRYRRRSGAWVQVQ